MTGRGADSLGSRQKSRRARDVAGKIGSHDDDDDDNDNDNRWRGVSFLFRVEWGRGLASRQ